MGILKRIRTAGGCLPPGLAEGTARADPPPAAPADPGRIPAGGAVAVSTSPRDLPGQLLLFELDTPPARRKARGR